MTEQIRFQRFVRESKELIYKYARERKHIIGPITLIRKHEGYTCATTRAFIATCSKCDYVIHLTNTLSRGPKSHHIAIHKNMKMFYSALYDAKHEENIDDVMQNIQSRADSIESAEKYCAYYDSMK